MKGKDLWEALGEIDPKYIQEAELSGRSRTGRQKWQAAAACFLVIAMGAAIVVPNLLWSQDSILWGGISGDSQDQSGQQAPITGSDSAENTIQISLSDVPVNIISGLPEGEMTDMSYVALMSEDQITWSQEQVESYYGLDFDTLSVPEDLEAVADLSQGMAVWENEDGTMRFDGLLLSYQSTGQEDPEETQRSLSLHGSKIGLLALSDSLYLTEEVKTWNFQGVEITLGYCQMDYGPYDETTHAPAGSYPVYTAEFTYNGAQFRLVGQRLTRREMVTAIATLLSQGEEVEVTS